MNEREITHFMIVKMAVNADIDLTFTRWGIASRIENEIILNRDLLDYKELCYNIMLHELEHTGKFTTLDFLSDVFVRQNGLWRFVLTHPRALTQMVPFGYRKGYWWVDYTLLILYGLIGVLLWLILTSG